MTDNKVETKKESGIVAYDPILDEGMEIVDPAEMIVSRALACQAMSVRVADGKAKPGQIIDGLDGTLLAEPQIPVEIICFHPVRQWVCFLDTGTGKADFSHIEPMTAENVNQPWEEQMPEGLIKRNKALGYFFLVPEEIKSGSFFPRLVTFSRTSYKAGRKISTQQVKLAAIKRPLCGRVFKLFTLKTTNDKGTFYVFDVEPGRDTTTEELAAAAQWKRVVMSSNTKVQDQTKEEVPF